MTVPELVDALPKAELHVHLEGTLEPDDLRALAARNGVELPWADGGRLRAAYSFTGLEDFLALFYLGCTVVRTRRDVYDLTRTYLRRAAAQNVRRAEMFFSPQNFLDRIDIADQVAALDTAIAEARVDLGIDAAVIVVAQRHRDESEALELLEMLAPHRGSILGVGLGGPEVGNPPAKFARFFDAAHRAGYRRTAHAGEEGPPAYVREALDVCRVERVDHGYAATRDPDLVARLADDGVALTLCPLSNLRLRVVDDLRSYAVRRLTDEGVAVTVNSDDPPYFGGGVNDNYRALVRALDMDADEVVALARRSVTASFADPADVARTLADIDTIHRAVGTTGPDTSEERRR
ncbi:adenosine deaminase [Pseudonocardia endophytica]|uniref:Adenine deaminase n=1 Tax=Pseudonocardia endophytica TaxID=401976 RepID=A0A4V2PHV6_PSEEN|nr:adenosine deaminase [Pseudonocardia endophytica]TCK22246.1 adenosine deaminase [Pseudonocardia endophytica]